MAIQLFGDPNNLQGGVNPMNVANPIQTANPQQAYNPTAPAPQPAPKPRATPAPRPVVAAPARAPQAQPVQISSMFAPYVQTRPSPSNPGVLEYFNPQNNIGFSNPNDVFNYIRTMTGQSITDLKQLEGSTSSYGGGYGGYGGSNSASITDPNQNIAQLAGSAGIAYEDYLKLIQNQNSLSFEERERIKQGLGIPDLESEIFKPAPSTENLYKSAYDTAGLGSLKSKIEAKLAEVNKIQSKYTETEGKVNENPFLSEASRVGRLRILDDKRLQEIGNLNDQLSSMKELYNAGVNEVNNLVTRQSADFSANQNLNSLKLQYLQGKAEEQITSKQNEKVSAAYSYLPDYLRAKAASQKPDTIGSNETGYYRWNPNTSTFEMVIPPQVTPNYQANPLTGELYDSKTGLGPGGGSMGNDIIGNLAQQVLANPNLLGNLPSAQQTAVIARLAQTGNSIPNKPLSGDAAKLAGIVQTAPAEIQKLITAFRTDYKGTLNGILLGTKPELRRLAEQVADKVGRIRSGGAVNVDEANRFFGQLVKKSDLLFGNADTSINALQGILNEINQVSSSLGLGGGGGFNPNDPLGIRFNSVGNTSASTPYLKTLGPVTGLNGSAYWANGLDVDLRKGDPVRSPVAGVVIAAAPNGGFGNQIKIKAVDGREIWLSHLDSGSVKVGQIVNPGEIVGIGGNTGKTIAGPGGDGSHLDITVKDANGKLLTAPQVKSYLDKIYV